MLLKVLDSLWFSRPATALRTAGAEAAELVVPTWCVGCRAPGVDLCPGCRQDLRLLLRHPFRAEDPAEALPLMPDLSVLPVFSAAEYSTLVADVVLAYKDHERVQLGPLLAQALERALRAAATHCSGEQVLIVWPPSSPQSYLARGRRPVDELMGRVGLPEGAERAGHLVASRLIPRDLSRAGRGQKTRSKRARRKTDDVLRLAPGAAARLSGAEVILVDDVLTTGATLGGLYQRLTAVGARVRAAAVIAATPR